MILKTRKLIICKTNNNRTIWMGIALLSNGKRASPRMKDNKNVILIYGTFSFNPHIKYMDENLSTYKYNRPPMYMVLFLRRKP